MSEENIEYFDLYENPTHNPTAVKKGSGLMGLWAILPKEQSQKKWQYEDSAAPDTGFAPPPDTGFAPPPDTGFAPPPQKPWHKEPFVCGCSGIYSAESPSPQNNNGDETAKQHFPRTPSTLIHPERSLELLRFVFENNINLDNKTIADIGCGDGSLAILASFTGATVHAVDPSPQQLAFLRSIADIERLKPSISKHLETISRELVSPIPGLILTHQACAEALPLPSRSLDSVFFKFTLNWTDDQKALDEAKRVLKPGGSLFIMTTAPLDDTPSLFCRAWNELVENMQKGKTTFKNLEHPKNPNPIHYLPYLVRNIEGRGFNFKKEKSKLEETARNPEIFLHYLTGMIGEQLLYCFEGDHRLDTPRRNKILAAMMHDIARDSGTRPRIIEKISMLHFQKKP